MQHSTITEHSIVHTGTSTKGLKMLSAGIHGEIQKKWESVVTPVTGCATYKKLRKAWKQENAAQ